MRQLPIEIPWMLISMGRVLGAEHSGLIHLQRLIVSKAPLTDDELRISHGAMEPAVDHATYAMAAGFRAAFCAQQGEQEWARYYALRALAALREDDPGEGNLQLLEAVGWGRVQAARALLAPREPA